MFSWPTEYMDRQGVKRENSLQFGKLFLVVNHNIFYPTQKESKHDHEVVTV